MNEEALRRWKAEQQEGLRQELRTAGWDPGAPDGDTLKVIDLKAFVGPRRLFQTAPDHQVDPEEIVLAIWGPEEDIDTHIPWAVAALENGEDWMPRWGATELAEAILDAQYRAELGEASERLLREESLLRQGGES